ncbi:MAG: OmpA family protein [Gammaproteobacteria bacterium]|nr:OmpA family protein [Gammaproteobacteria bacterium]
MQMPNSSFTVAAAVAFVVSAVGAHAQSTPTEQEIIEALLPGTGGASGAVRTRSMSGDRGVSVSGGTESVPSIDLKVNFEFDSARLDNESMLTLDVLGRALSSDELKGQAIEIVGHTDAKGTVEYNDALSQRRAAAVVGYIVGKFAVDGSRIASKGMGERRLLDKAHPEAAENRRVEIRNVTRTQ